MQKPLFPCSSTYRQTCHVMRVTWARLGSHDDHMTGAQQNKMPTGRTSSVFLAVFLGVLCTVLGDTPANCSYDDIKGHWTFQLAQGGHDNTVDCSEMGELSYISICLCFGSAFVLDSSGKFGLADLGFNPQTVTKEYTFCVHISRTAQSLLATIAN